jgi:hypothetical protein
MYAIALDQVAEFNLQNARAFVEFWSRYYSDGMKVLDADEKICYVRELILTNDLTEENVCRLLRWKDPRLLTHRILSGPNKGQDNPRVAKVLATLGLINQFRNGQTTEEDMGSAAERVFTQTG